MHLLTNFGFLDLGAPELLIVLAIVVLLFGGKKLPEISKGLGQSIRELKSSFSEAQGLKEDAKGQIKQTQQALRGGSGDGRES